MKLFSLPLAHLVQDHESRKGIIVYIILFWSHSLGPDERDSKCIILFIILFYELMNLIYKIIKFIKNRNKFSNSNPDAKQPKQRLWKKG